MNKSGSDVNVDGDRITVTTPEGHSVTFGLEQLAQPEMSGSVTTDWAGVEAPSDAQAIVQSAKVDAEQYAMDHGLLGKE